MRLRLYSYLKRSSAVMLALFVLYSHVEQATAELLPERMPPTTEKRCGTTSAGTTVEKTWRATRVYFGAQAFAAPRFHFVTDHFWEMVVEGGENGYRQITIHGAAREALAGERGCQERREARVSLIHEFAHVYQLPWVYEGQYADQQFDEAIPEGTAEAFAEWVVRNRFGWTRPDWAASWDVYGAYANEARRRYSAQFIHRDQFGDQWGTDPRLVPIVS